MRSHEPSPTALSLQLSELRVNTNQGRKQSIESSWNIDEWCSARLWLQSLPGVPQHKHNILSTERIRCKKWDCSSFFLHTIPVFPFFECNHFDHHCLFHMEFFFSKFHLSEVLCKFEKTPTVLYFLLKIIKTSLGWSGNRPKTLKKENYIGRHWKGGVVKMKWWMVKRCLMR